MRRLHLILVPLFVASVPLAGQEPVIRLDVNLVQVDAVVTNSAGKHAGNLKSIDFEILQDGKPQTITNFSWIAPGTPVRAAAVARGAVTPPPVAVPLPKPAEVRRTLAFVVDDFTMSVGGLAHVRDALRKYVNYDMQPGDLVAVIRTSSGTGLLQQFTSDRTVLNAAIDHVRFVLNPGNLTRDVRKAGTLGAIQYVIDGLRDMPGRKSLILFSENLPTLEVVVMGAITSPTHPNPGTVGSRP